MKSMRCQTSCCSRCRHYTPEGRRGGHCSQLGVPVQGRWTACSLSAPVFLTPMPETSSVELLPQPLEIYFPSPQMETLEVSARSERVPLTVALQSR
ncbi:MAG: hypothetical protein HC922_04340 [Leptolyngbyaceae cyanobacterium SM2_3_12]|nr:hypothetical protein [Leptolyngbyaceae cyanobacterium SM2_3_12]